MYFQPLSYFMVDVISFECTWRIGESRIYLNAVWNAAERVVYRREPVALAHILPLGLYCGYIIALLPL